MSAALDTDFYFANPYHSRERGLNEHTNGLIRQYLPKKSEFLKVSKDEILTPILKTSAIFWDSRER